MRTLSVCCLALLCVATLTAASPAKKIEKKSIPNELAPKAIEPTDQKAEESKLNEETLLETPGENVERSKKHTTTFCVEIKNDRPVQVECSEVSGGSTTIIDPVHEDLIEPVIGPAVAPIAVPCTPEIGAYVFRKPTEIMYAYNGIPVPGSSPSLFSGVLPGHAGLLHSGIQGGLPHYHSLHPGMSPGVECTCKSTPNRGFYPLRGVKSMVDGESIDSAITNEDLALQFLKNVEKNAEAQMSRNSMAASGLDASKARQMNTSPSTMRSSSESSPSASKSSSASSIGAVDMMSSAPVPGARQSGLSTTEMKQTSSRIPVMKATEQSIPAAMETAQATPSMKQSSAPIPVMMQSIVPSPMRMMGQTNVPPSSIMMQSQPQMMMMKAQSPVMMQGQAPIMMQDQPMVMVQEQPSVMLQSPVMVQGQPSFEMQSRAPVMIQGQPSFEMQARAPAMMQANEATSFIPQVSQDSASGQSAAARTIQIFPGGGQIMGNPVVSGLPIVQTMEFRGLPVIPCADHQLLLASARMDAKSGMNGPAAQAQFMPTMSSLDTAKQMLIDQPQQQRQLTLNSAPQMIQMPGFPMLNGGLSPFMGKSIKPDCLEDVLNSGIPLMQNLRMSRGPDEKDAKAQEKEQREKSTAKSGSRISDDELDHIIKNGGSMDDSTNARIARFFPLDKNIEINNLLEDD